MTKKYKSLFNIFIFIYTIIQSSFQNNIVEDVPSFRFSNLVDTSKEIYSSNEKCLGTIEMQQKKVT